MRRSWKLSGLAIAAALGATCAFAMNAPAQAQVSAKRGIYHHHVGVAYAPNSRRVGRGHGTHFAELVGDPHSGLGFYQLPLQYRVGAWRYHLRNQRPLWQNPVISAMAADAARYNYIGATPVEAYRYGVYNPYDGVGTPYFAGYYGPAGDDDEPSFPFGRPYTH